VLREDSHPGGFIKSQTPENILKYCIIVQQWQQCQNQAMGTLEIRSHLHQIIDGIQNEQFLQTLYDFLRVKKTDSEQGIWNALSTEQKAEVMLAFEESEDENNLIDPSKVFGSGE